MTRSPLRARVLGISLGAAIATALIVAVVLRWPSATTPEPDTADLLWTIHDSGGGNVTANHGQLSLAVPAPQVGAPPRAALAVAGSEAWRDYSVLVRATVLTPTSESASAPSFVRLLVRYTRPDRGYYVSLGTDALDLGKLEYPGGAAPLASAAAFRAAPEQPRTYRVSIEGATLRVAVDGEPAIEYTDPDPIPAGGVGVWVQAARARVQNASVRPVATPAGTSPVISFMRPSESARALLESAVTTAATPEPSVRAQIPSTPSPRLHGIVAWGDLLTADGSAQSTSPQAPQSISAIGATALAAGRQHSLAVDASGSVWSWGHNASGQLGRATSATCGPPGPCDTQPGRVSGLSGVVAVAAGDAHSLALRSDGSVWGWGSNAAGQLGQRSAARGEDVEQITGTGDMRQIAAGRAFSIALRGDGTVWAWGANEAGQLGNGTLTSSAEPVQVLRLDGVKQIAAGEFFGVALRSDGTVWTWGANEYGQLGLGMNGGGQVIPRPVDGLSQVVSIGAGSYHALAVRADGGLVAWGANWHGELGSSGPERCTFDGSEHPCSSVPRPVSHPDVVRVTAVAGGEFHSLALTSSGQVLAWGRNSAGELGDAGAAGPSTAQPTGVHAVDGARLIAAGRKHSLAAVGAPATHATGEE